MEKMRIIGSLIGLIGIALAWIFFSWKLALVLIITMWGNNIEQKFNK